MVVCVECLPADKPWDVVSATRRSSGVAPRACVRVHARVLVPPNLYIHTYIFHFEALVARINRPFAAPPIYIVHTIAMLLQYTTPPLSPPVPATPPTSPSG